MYHYHDIRLNVAPGVYPPSEDSLLLARNITPNGRVLEIGTGTGIIAIHLAKKGFEVVATDINPYAIECARDNVSKNGVEDKVDVVRADLMNGLRGPFDTIVFNPPYLPSRPLGELRGMGELGTAGLLDGILDRDGLTHMERYPGDARTLEDLEEEEKNKEDMEKEPDDWLSRSWSGGKDGAEVLGRFMGELTDHLATGGKGYLVVSSLTDLKLPTDLGLDYRVVAEQRFPFERISVLEVFRRSAEEH